MPALVTAACAALLLLVAAPAASAQDVAGLAARMAGEVVVVEPGMEDELPVAQAGAVRTEIALRAPGRVRMAVVTPAAMDAAGGPGALANGLDAAGALRGALLVTDGERFHVVTSHPRPVVDALRPVLDPPLPQSLRERLVGAVGVLAAVDPGAGEDLRPAEAPPTSVTIGVPDGVWDTLRGIALVAALVVAAPFALLFAVLAVRLVRRRREARRDLGDLRAAARARLVGVAEAVTDLEDAHGTAPGYARLLEHYAVAEALVDVAEPDPRALRRAETALGAAEREAAALRGDAAAVVA